MSTPTQHSALGASSAHRWMACPGSVKMSEGVEDVAVQSPYATEGTLAHSYAEVMIANPDWDKASTIGGAEIPIEMPEYVRIYTDLITQFQTMCDWSQVECMFSLESLEPPVDAYGTADFVGYRAEDESLIVADLKYGTGIVVEPEGNVQLMYYAVGALLAYQAAGNNAPVKRVRLVIVQPRAFHPDGAIREAVIDIEDLMEFSFTLIQGMHDTQREDAALIPGDHCRWCRAAAVCPALLEKNQEIAGTDFSDDVAEVGIDPRTLSPEYVGHMLMQLDSIEHWINSVRMYAQNELERGNDIPGWKLVAKQARRKWKDEDEALEVLGAYLTNEELLVTPKLKSPAQVEKIWDCSVPESLTSKTSSGNKIARASSPLPAITAGSEFFE